MKLLEKAIKDRHVIVDPKRTKVTYLPHIKERKLSNPEEQVQLQTFLDLIYTHQYPSHKIKVCEKVKIGSSTREADIVVYRDDDCKDPLIIVECKKEGVSNSIFQGAVDQGFSYAAVTTAEYVWATSGDRNAYFEVWPQAINERKRNTLHRVPRHNAKKGLGSQIRKRLRWFMRHPIISDTLVYSLILLITTLILSKLAVAYFPELYDATKFLWENHGMNYNWVYNAIILVSALVSLLFGAIFMQSHRLFNFSPTRKKLSYTLIAVLLFVPPWYLGVSNADPNWWTWQHYHQMKYETVMYLWPYLKAMPFQALAIYGLIWVMGRG